MTYQADPVGAVEEPSPLTGPRPTGRPRRRADDTATRAARGIADGFSEASQAFSDELRGTDGYADLMERSVAGVIRANGRFLEELASVFRRVADDVADDYVYDDYGYGDEAYDDYREERRRRRPGRGSRRPAAADIDYERLADMVADRLHARMTPPSVAPDVTA